MNKKGITTAIFLTIIFGLNIYISGIISIFSITISLFIYSLIIYLLYFLYQKLKKKNLNFFSLENYKNFLLEFLYKISLLIVVLFSIIGIFSYYQNEISPAFMPTYTLSNGDKTIVFQTMSHIGTKNFYDKVLENIKNLKENSYVLYYEGVKPGTKENMENFNNALGIKLENDTYENVGKIYGLLSQRDFNFLGIVNDKDYNVDISIDEIMEEYNKFEKNSNSPKETTKEAIDIGNLIIEELKNLTENELEVYIYINKALMNMFIKNENLQNIIENNFADKNLLDVILNKRNEVLAQKILSSNDKKIIVTYGMLHFAGVFEILKQNDIRWQIKEIEYLYPIK